MFNSFRSRFAAAAIIVVFTVAACCSPSEPTGTCWGPSEKMDMGQDMSDMAMLSDPIIPCDLSIQTENDPQPPLYPYIGSAHWHVPWAQDYFDQGLRFFFAFNFRESYRAFRAAAYEAEDSGIPCSACYWAQALPLGVDINRATQSEPDRKAAKAALHRAIEANPNAEDWEMIRALFGRYQDCNVKNEKGEEDEKKCQQIRNESYYHGMKRVLETFGKDDPNVITLFADSVMNLSKGYWEPDGSPVSERVTEARDALERALKFGQYPPNEGPIHWYIHLMEQSLTPDAVQQYADLLAPISPFSPLAPNAGHLLHMPSHIYYRMGDMKNVIRANKEAIAADERYLSSEPNLYRPDGDRYKYGFYTHNIYFLLAAAVLSGDDKERDVDRFAEKLFESTPDKADGFLADKFRSVYYLAKLNFSSTANIRKFAAPNPFDQQPLANVAYDYAQLMADIWDGKDSTQSAGKFDADIAKFQNAAATGERNAGRDKGPKSSKSDLRLAAILSFLGHARMGAAKGDWDAAVTAARGAVDIQDNLYYEEPPLWLYPARQTLASVLIRRAEVDGPRAREYLAEAKQELLKSLNKSPEGNPNPQTRTGTYPGNAWAYYGLWKIANRDGSSQPDIDRARADLDDHWFGTAEFLNLYRL
jgi:hypothetical protein